MRVAPVAILRSSRLVIGRKYNDLSLLRPMKDGSEALPLRIRRNLYAIEQARRSRGFGTRPPGFFRARRVRVRHNLNRCAV
jgi:hypothetical protein